MLVALAMSMLLVGTASASVTSPPDPNTFGFATLSNITLNGQSTTVLQATPGSSVTLTADWSDSHPDKCPHCIDFIAVGLQDAANPAGCLENGDQTGASGNGSVALEAPDVAGFYNVIGRASQVYHCSDQWPGPWENATIAVIIVSTPSSLCDLVWQDSTSADVATGLCNKLTAAQDAHDRGQTKAAAHILSAFDHQLSAQTGKALTADQVNTILALQDYLF